MNLYQHPAVISFLGSLCLIQAILLLVLPPSFFSPQDLPNPSGDQRVLSYWSGGVSAHAARVSAKLSCAGIVRLYVSEDSADFSDAVFTRPKFATEASYFFVTLELEDLSPNTDYWYRFEINGMIDTGPKAIGHLKTFRNGPFSFDVAFGSCARTGSNSRIFRTIEQAAPDLYLNTGDIHYGDVGKDCDSLHHRAMQAVLSSPAQAQLYRSIPIAYIWDDHDFGPDNSSYSAYCNASARRSYQQYVPHYPLAFEEGDPVISQSFVIGRLRFVLTDLRSAKRRPAYRDCMRIREGSNFGSDRHLNWFLSELLEAKQAGQLVTWVSGIPYIGTAGDALNWCEEKDGWAGYPEERQRIANFIRDHEIPICILSGDAHMLAIDDGSHSDYAKGGGAEIPVFHAAPLDRYPSVKGGPYSHGTRAVSGQYGWMHVEDLGGDSIHVYWEGKNLDGQRVKSDLGKPLVYAFSRFLGRPPSDRGLLVAAESLDHASSLVSIWPNPNRDFLHLRMPESWPSSSIITIHDLRGQELIDTTLDYLNPIAEGEFGLAHQLSPGIYFLRAYQPRDTVIQRFLVE